MHKCAADRLAMVVEVVFTPPAAQQDFARQVHLDSALQARLDLEALLVSVRLASAVSAQPALGDSVPAVFAPPVLALDRAASARLERALLPSPVADSSPAAGSSRAEHLVLAQ
jgi:hypothetical protein